MVSQLALLSNKRLVVILVSLNFEKLHCILVLFLFEVFQEKLGVLLSLYMQRFQIFIDQSELVYPELRVIELELLLHALRDIP